MINIYELSNGDVTINNRKLLSSISTTDAMLVFDLWQNNRQLVWENNNEKN